LGAFIVEMLGIADIGKTSKRPASVLRTASPPMKGVSYGVSQCGISIEHAVGGVVE
jgi:hypothetical protein